MEEQVYQPKLHWFLFFAGVILPAISITVEATTHICATVFFDPIPSTWHLLIVIFVPLAQLQVWFAIRRGAQDRLRLAGFLNAAVIAISFFYSIVYLPLLPMSLLAVLIGLGLLSLVPYFSLGAALVMRRRLKQIAATAANQSFSVKTRGLLVGLGVTVAVLGAIELPSTLTRIGLQKAISPSPQTRAEGIRLLRNYGSKDALLRSCYNQTGRATDLLGYTFSIENPVTPVEARKIYYRVTGEAFDSSAPPERIGGGRIVPQETFDFDADQGGTEIRGKLRGLSLGESQIMAKVDGNGSVGYMQWTLVFQNESDEQREARAEVQLPPGAVVSRLTLWVNGEPREAAFGGRNQVRQAYQQVAIRQRRDPVLVTTAGRDRILVQCFPVPVRGEMKIRLGITIPLLLDDPGDSTLIMPHFLSRNFRIPNRVVHRVWVESTNEMKYSWLYSPEQTPNGDFAYSGAVNDARLSDSESSIKIKKSEFDEVWSENPFDPNFVIKQVVREQPPPAHLQRIVIVVDTSEAMKKWVPEMQSGINTTLPDDFDLKIVFADSDGISAGGPTQTPVANRSEVWNSLEYARFVGGADNVPALRKAWLLAAERPGNNAIVWIHSPQGLLLDSVDELENHLAQNNFGPTLYSLQTTNGVDEIMKQLDGFDQVRSVTRTSELSRDIQSVLARLIGKEKTFQMVRTTVKRENSDLSRIVKASDHLARLWANDEVARILAPRDASLTDAAITLAARYQLVTPVTGAVVLETEEQYRANGLEPVNAGTVPTIPEPGMIALLIVAGAFFVWLAYMKHRKSGSGRCTV